MHGIQRPPGWRALGVALFSVLAFVIAATGCRKEASEEATDSDANGYLCPKCSAKFFTARTLFAERCPSCGDLEIREVMGFVCPQDQHVTLGPRNLNSVPCGKCQQPVSVLKLPREKELTAWGAVRAAPEKVLIRP